MLQIGNQLHRDQSVSQCRIEFLEGELAMLLEQKQRDSMEFIADIKELVTEQENIIASKKVVLKQVRNIFLKLFF